MRQTWTTAAALCFLAFTSACNADGEGPSIDTIRADVESEVDRIIGDPAAVSIESIQLGESVVAGEKRVMFSADFTGIAVAEAPLFGRGSEPGMVPPILETYYPLTPSGTKVPIKGKIAYVLDGEKWMIYRRHTIMLATGEGVLQMGIPELIARGDGAYPLRGSPEAAAMHAAMIEAEAEKKMTKAEREQKARAKRDAELKALLEERKRLKAEEAGANSP